MTDFMEDMKAMQVETLHPDLEAWVEEDGPMGAMLRHPLVYDMMVRATPGLANRSYEYKKQRLVEAEAEKDWRTCIFLHERPYRFRALIDYTVGRDLDGFIYPLNMFPEYCDLATDVWIDSENIEQHIEDWNALLQNGAGLWLGGDEGKRAFDALPDPIPAWRGGIVGDWSWTTEPKVAEFFSRRSGYPMRHAMIPKADVFGYLLDRHEAELMVRMTDERRPLVYPNEVD